MRQPIFSTTPSNLLERIQSRMTGRRIKEVIGIRYDDIDKMPAIVDEVKALLIAHKGINQSESLRVCFNYFNASSLDITVYAFTNTISKGEYVKIKQEILLAIAVIITKHKAEIAFPTQTLYIQK
jgi:MscS family membrane protein